MKGVFAGLLFLFSCIIFAQDTAFGQILSYIKKKDFFTAQKNYDAVKNELNEFQQYFVEAYLENAFNQLEKSKMHIDVLLTEYSTQLSDKNKADFLSLQHENALKLFDYKLGKKCLEKILNEYKHVLTEDELKDYQNGLIILTALENEKPQKLYIDDLVKIKMIRDQVGLKNLPVQLKSDTLNFVFDTGANISTTTRSVAEKYGLKILKGEIEVGTITGKMVKANLAICEDLKIQSLRFENVVFIVFEDEDLAFPQIDYQIIGILGFPLLESLKEIQITQDDYFIVPQEQSTYDHPSNLALENLQPIIQLNGKHFTLDTGATQSMLYRNYFEENRDKIVSTYPQTKVRFGGAGGSREFAAYDIPWEVELPGHKIQLDRIPVLIEDNQEKPSPYYGNIGQDFFGKFYKMTINFSKMFVRFD